MTTYNIKLKAFPDTSEAMSAMSIAIKALNKYTEENNITVHPIDPKGIIPGGTAWLAPLHYSDITSNPDITDVMNICNVEPLCYKIDLESHYYSEHPMAMHNKDYNALFDAVDNVAKRLNIKRTHDGAYLMLNEEQVTMAKLLLPSEYCIVGCHE